MNKLVQQVLCKPELTRKLLKLSIDNWMSTSMESLHEKPKVYVTRGGFPQTIIEPLVASCDVEICEDVYSSVTRAALLKGVAGKHAIFCLPTETIDEELLDAAGSQLRVIGTISVGVDHINVPECKKRGVRIGNTPGVLTDATAELGVALLLATTRRLMEGHNDVKNGEWKTWHPFLKLGKSLLNSTVGIVGFGRIGQAVAKRLRPFGVQKILYCGHNKKPEDEVLGAEYVSFEDLLKQSDFVIGCCSLNDTTRNLFNAKAFALMKPTATFVNISRGLIVDQDALYSALTTGQIHAAGLDVTTPEPFPPSHPLVNLPNCVIIPHIGSADEGTRYRMAEMTVKNILAALSGKEMPAEI
ncbi:hypothetical protein CHUAL_002368 [Chamberlinius hualienensis]